MGEGSATVRVWAPGRVNLIGDHTDYVGGLALPMAIDLGTTIVGRPVDDRVRLGSADDDEAVDLAVDAFADPGADPARIDPAWGRYVAAVMAEVRPPTGFEGRVSTTLPIGAGLSSSAALEVAVALALGARLPPVELALACQRAEQRASGVPCGVMDQLTAICGVADHALLVDFRTLTFEVVAVPSDVEIVVVHSGQARVLADSKYAERRAELAAAEDEIGPLRDAAMDDVATIRDPVIRRRARYVIGENDRVRAFASALGSGDGRALGSALRESQISSRDEFESSTPLVDALVERLDGSPGVFGARMVGGGFGGCVVALTEPGALAEGWKVHASSGASIEAI